MIWFGYWRASSSPEGPCEPTTVVHGCCGAAWGTRATW